MANFTMPTNITSWSQVVEYTNTVTSDWFSIIVVLLTFIILFINMKNYPTTKAFAAASFITAIVTILFKLMGLMNDIVFFLTLIAAGLSVVFLIIEQSN